MTPIEIVPRIASILFCKTHKWALLARIDDKLKYAVRNTEMKVGEEATLEEIFGAIAEGKASQWSLSALTEPALPETDVAKSLDFLYPIDVDHLATAVTPQSYLKALLLYYCKTAAVIGMPFHYRGFPDMQPAETVHLLENPGDVSCNGMLLCGETLKQHRCIEQGGSPDRHLWASRALQELFPCAYYQKMSSRNNDTFLYYVVGALNGLTDAKAVWDVEMAELNDRRKIGTRMTDSAFLCRHIGIDAEDGYCDQMLKEPTTKANKTLVELMRKLIIIASRSNPMHLVDPDITLEASITKREVLKLHNEDALGPITAFAWKEL